MLKLLCGVEPWVCIAVVLGRSHDDLARVVRGKAESEVSMGWEGGLPCVVEYYSLVTGRGSSHWRQSPSRAERVSLWYEIGCREIRSYMYRENH